MFYLEQGIPQIRQDSVPATDAHCELSLLSCAILQEALLVEGKIPLKNRIPLEDLCKKSYESTDMQLRSHSLYCNHHVISAIAYAVRSTYKLRTKSRDTLDDGDAEAVESCK